MEYSDERSVIYSVLCKSVYWFIGGDCMKKLYADQKHTLYEIERHLGIGKGRLYNYINKKRDYKKIDIDFFIKLADYEGIGIRELYRKMKEYLGD